jgi:hypothetical protein
MRDVGVPLEYAARETGTVEIHITRLATAEWNLTYQPEEACEALKGFARFRLPQLLGVVPVW